MKSTMSISAAVLLTLVSTSPCGAFYVPSSSSTKQSTTRIQAKAQRLEENVDGALYVNSKVSQSSRSSY